MRTTETSTFFKGPTGILEPETSTPSLALTTSLPSTSSEGDISTSCNLNPSISYNTQYLSCSTSTCCGSSSGETPTPDRWFLSLTNPLNHDSQPLLALFDTGSCKSYISTEGLNALQEWEPKEISIPKFVVVVANGVRCMVDKAYRVNIGLEEKQFEVTFHLIPDLTSLLLIGLDSISTFGMLICSEGRWKFSDDHSRYYQFCSPTTIYSLSIRHKERLDEIIALGMKSLKDNSGRTNLITHHIDVGDAKPVKQRAYNYSPKVLEAMHAELDVFLLEDKVEPSQAEWASPVVMVRKPDESYRFCVDYRQVNKITKGDSYPMPNLSSLLDSLSKARYMSKIDLKNAFLQVPLSDESSKDITSFIVPGRGLFRFKVMPFGLTNSPATFQRLVDKLFGPDLFPFVIAYLDDILIVTPDFETHCRLLQEVFHRLQKAGLKVNADKCDFCCQEIKYLGYVVTPEGLSTDPDKVAPVINFPPPKTIRQLRRFLGMAGWYRRFIPNFSSIAAPLTALQKKNSRWRWTEDQEHSFDALKEAITSAPILARPDFSLPFVLITDASQVGLGAVLVQVQDGIERVITYSSRTLSASERNYSVTERECLAVVWGISNHRQYLEGFEFKVITDHSSLKWLLNLKDPTGRLARWSLKLQQYRFDVEYRKGSQNVVADTLSRIPEVSSLVPDVPESLGSHDPWYDQKYLSVKNKPHLYPDWSITGGRLYYLRPNSLKSSIEATEDDWKLVPRPDQRKEIITQNHDSLQAGHLGISKTYWRISQEYYWPNMLEEVTQYVKRCIICQQVKADNQPPRGMMQKRHISSPWECVSLDLMGPYPRSLRGKIYLLVFQDVFSRWVELVPLRKATSEVIVEKFRDTILNRFGCPSRIITDNGSNLVSSCIRAITSICGIKHQRTPFYHSQANPVERSNRNVKQIIVSYLKGSHKDWDRYLGEAQFALNSVCQETTKYSPAFLVYGREMKPVSPWREQSNDEDLQYSEDEHIKSWAKRMNKLKEIYHIVESHVAKANENQSKRYNLRRRPDSFQPGNLVLRKRFVQSSKATSFCAKLCPKYEGPYLITSVSPAGVCHLEDECGRDLGFWHSSKLKLFHV